MHSTYAFFSLFREVTLILYFFEAFIFQVLCLSRPRVSEINDFFLRWTGTDTQTNDLKVSIVNSRRVLNWSFIASHRVAKADVAGGLEVSGTLTPHNPEARSGLYLSPYESN